jgi:lysophospholipase L1-like esterase
MFMQFTRKLSSLFFVLVNLANICGAGSDLRLTLPPAIYAVPGLETNIYFDNIILSQTPDQFQFKVTCDPGETKTNRWSYTPKQTDVGKHALSVSVYGSDDVLLGTASTILHVVPQSAGAKNKIRLLIIGDSLTNATVYPNEIGRLLSQSGNPEWTMLGTRKPRSVSKGVAYEGHGGWTWARFVTQYEPDQTLPEKQRSSPFVYLNKNTGKSQLDLSRYFDERCDGERPDYIVILLGINDCFHADPDDPARIDARIDKMFKSANKLLAALRKTAPKATIGFCVTTPPNSRQAAFYANYKNHYSRWGWKRIQHRLVQRQLEEIANRDDPQISIIPTQLNLDTVDGYPVDNGVHPNIAGYHQIAATIYSWLKWQMSDLE